MNINWNQIDEVIQHYVSEQDHEALEGIAKALNARIEEMIPTIIRLSFKKTKKIS